MMKDKLTIEERKERKYKGYSKGNRIHKGTINGKNRVLTWIQERCIICQRFLAKHQQKYCKKCTSKFYKYKEYDKLYYFVYCHAKEINIGDII